MRCSSFLGAEPKNAVKLLTCVRYNPAEIRTIFGYSALVARRRGYSSSRYLPTIFLPVRSQTAHFLKVPEEGLPSLSSLEGCSQAPGIPSLPSVSCLTCSLDVHRLGRSHSLLLFGGFEGKKTTSWHQYSSESTSATYAHV